MQSSSAEDVGLSVSRVRAANLLYRTHVDAVYLYLARRVGRELAADLVADTFRIAVEDLDRYDAGRGSQRAWLFGIATNQLRRHWRTETRRLRALSRHAAADVPLGDPLLRVVEQIDAAADTDRLLAAVANLEVEDRDLLVLVAWERCSHREVAEALGIPMGTVRSRLHRIRAMLRAEMDTTLHGEMNDDDG